MSTLPTTTLPPINHKAECTHAATDVERRKCRAARITAARQDHVCTEADLSEWIGGPSTCASRCARHKCSVCGTLATVHREANGCRVGNGRMRVNVMPRGRVYMLSWERSGMLRLTDFNDAGDGAQGRIGHSAGYEFFALDTDGREVLEILPDASGNPAAMDDAGVVDWRGNDSWDLCMVIAFILRGHLSMLVTRRTDVRSLRPDGDAWITHTLTSGELYGEALLTLGA